MEFIHLIFLIINIYATEVIKDHLPLDTKHLFHYNNCKRRLHKRSPTTLKVNPNTYAICATDTTLELICKFDSPVSCAWTRKGYHVEIKNRYSYIDANNGTNTLDCTVMITVFRAIDAGLWQCKSLATSLAQANMGSVICLIHQPTISVQPNPSIVTKLKSSIIIECIFNSEELCVWLHNKTQIRNGKRYKFNESETKNCSLTIPSVQDDDAGNWKCQNMGNETILSVISSEAVVSIAKSPPQPQKLAYTLPRNQERSITCTSGDENPLPKLHWEVDGVRIISESWIKTDLQNAEISLNCDYITSKNASVLACVNDLHHTRAEIRLGDSFCLMKTEEGEPNQGTVSGGTITIIIVIILLVMALVACLIYILFLKRAYPFNKRKHKQEPTSAQEDQATSFQEGVPLQEGMPLQ